MSQSSLGRAGKLCEQVINKWQILWLFTGNSIRQRTGIDPSPVNRKWTHCPHGNSLLIAARAKFCESERLKTEEYVGVCHLTGRRYTMSTIVNWWGIPNVRFSRDDVCQRAESMTNTPDTIFNGPRELGAVQIRWKGPERTPLYAEAMLKE